MLTQAPDKASTLLPEELARYGFTLVCEVEDVNEVLKIAKGFPAAPYFQVRSIPGVHQIWVANETIDWAYYRQSQKYRARIEQVLFK